MKTFPQGDPDSVTYGEDKYDWPLNSMISNYVAEDPQILNWVVCLLYLILIIACIFLIIELFRLQRSVKKIREAEERVRGVWAVGWKIEEEIEEETKALTKPQEPPVYRGVIEI